MAFGIMIPRALNGMTVWTHSMFNVYLICVYRKPVIIIHKKPSSVQQTPDVAQSLSKECKHIESESKLCLSVWMTPQPCAWPYPESNAPAYAVIGHIEIINSRTPVFTKLYKIKQDSFFLFLTPSTGCWVRCDEVCCWLLRSFATTVFIAWVKISSTPVISLLLHSIYFAPIFRATAMPCSWVTGVKPWVLSRSMHVLFVRRSDLRPTRMRGVYGQKWRTSGYHCTCQLSRSYESVNHYLIHYVFEWVWAVDREADE